MAAAKYGPTIEEAGMTDLVVLLMAVLVMGGLSLLVITLIDLWRGR